jgi:2-(1,2-epoxy-1,2-dihydrophenyl)acetyl-CoA isomerase
MNNRITLDKTDQVARLIFDNPANRNAVDLPFCEQFAAAAMSCAADSSLRVIVIEARGAYFSVGGDLADFLLHESDIEHYVLQCTSQFHAGIRHLAQARAPVVVALNGMAAGGGFSIVCGADLVVAKRSARLNSGYTRSGLTPDGGGTFLLPRLVGWQRAFTIMALNETITADQACDLGLVTRVVDDERFEEEIAALITALKGSEALGDLKALMRAGANRSFSEQLDAEAFAIARRAGSAETLARLRAFLKRG